ncbi:DUF4489 domain-containing protein [Wukongibacter baidiensis]|uniref:DUF4489 domain-containing protein n=1 Tax=Wukongibacter baidiensis TaxID=1723361 RepID=UPI003D7FDFAB
MESKNINLSIINGNTNIFNFTFCDCMTCPECCDYFVTVTPIRIENAIVTVSNGTIAALAQEG